MCDLLVSTWPCRNEFDFHLFGTEIVDNDGTLELSVICDPRENKIRLSPRNGNEDKKIIHKKAPFFCLQAAQSECQWRQNLVS